MSLKSDNMWCLLNPELLIVQNRNLLDFTSTLSFVNKSLFFLCLISIIGKKTNSLPIYVNFRIAWCGLHALVVVP